MDKAVYDKQQGNNIQLTILECIHTCDKRDLLKNTSEFSNKTARFSTLRLTTIYS